MTSPEHPTPPRPVRPHALRILNSDLGNFLNWHRQLQHIDEGLQGGDLSSRLGGILLNEILVMARQYRQESGHIADEAIREEIESYCDRAVEDIFQIAEARGLRLESMAPSREKGR